jgi:hypothetical protein
MDEREQDIARAKFTSAIEAMREMRYVQKWPISASIPNNTK